MSLIESALQRLRRTGQPAGSTDGAPRTAAFAPAAKAPTVVVAPPREYVHKRIKLDPKALRTAGYLPQEGLERRFADHYRQIKRPLIDKAFSNRPDMRLILISSALPGDGKTFTTLNLAFSLARERDLSVLLVDADAPRGRISEVLGLRRERGLNDALADESLDIESLIVQTDVHGLEVLPAGTFLEGAPELLASARMEQIATRLLARAARGIVLFDSAPLLLSSEAQALLRLPGQVVLVVRVGTTPRQAALDAAARVDRSKLQGLILNQAAFTKADVYYGYEGYGETGDEARQTGVKSGGLPMTPPAG